MDHDDRCENCDHLRDAHEDGTGACLVTGCDCEVFLGLGGDDGYDEDEDDDDDDDTDPDPGDEE